MRNAVLAFTVVAGVTLAAAPPAGAQATVDPDAQQRAQKHYARGAGLMQNLRFQDALIEFSVAYKVFPAPTYLYLIAECYWNMSDNTTALHYYKLYREAAPNALNRYDVDKRIEALESGKHIESIKSVPPVSHKSSEPTWAELVQRVNAPESGPAATPAPTLAVAPQPAPAAAEPAATPVWKRWWFWTGLAVLAAGGAAAVVLTRSP